MVFKKYGIPNDIQYPLKNINDYDGLKYIT